MNGGSDAADQNEQNNYVQKNQCIWQGKTGSVSPREKFAANPTVPCVITYRTLTRIR